MKTLILVVNGKPESGKDTFAANIKNFYFRQNFLINNISTIDHIKLIAKLHFNWDGVKDYKGRKLLSDLKDASTNYNEGPFITVINTINDYINAHDDYNHIWIVHSREPEDIQRFVDYYKDKCRTVLIKREINQNIIQSNHADENVDYFDYNYTIENNGLLEDFNNTCVNFINNLGYF